MNLLPHLEGRSRGEKKKKLVVNGVGKREIAREVVITIRRGHGKNGALNKERKGSKGGGCK